jgi:hypothetical protein
MAGKLFQQPSVEAVGRELFPHIFGLNNHNFEIRSEEKFMRTYARCDDMFLVTRIF